MLPQEAKTYFDTLWATQSADAAMSFSREQGEYEKAEFATGQGPGGAGFAARLSALYKEDLSRRAGVIAETLKKAMTKNPFLKVWIANGYYDLATPYFATDSTVRQMGLDPAVRGLHE